MKAPIAISCLLIAASAGAGFALSAVHKVAFTTFDTQVVATFEAPAAAAPQDFVIPAYVPLRTAPVAVVPTQPEQPEIVPAVVEMTVDSDPLAEVPRPQMRPNWDIVVTMPHIDEDALQLPKKAARAPAAPRQAAYTPRKAPTATAPMIVSHVSAQDIRTNTRQPDYAHGVYR